MSSSATRLRQGFAGVDVLGRRSFSEGGKRMIQYAVLPKVKFRRRRLLDAPLLRGMTTEDWIRLSGRRNN
jgi:hypothetical protein